MILCGSACDDMHELNDRLENAANENQRDIETLKARKEALEASLHAPIHNIDDLGLNMSMNAVRAIIQMNIYEIDQAIYAAQLQDTLGEYTPPEAFG